MAQDSSKADFWDTRYRSAVTPWDQGGVPAALIAFAATRNDRPRTLIPGCGAAYEARFLVERGWPVDAIDFSEAALAAARAVLGPHAACLRYADFFDPAFTAAPFDIVYERAFLCALPPRTWPQYASQMAAVIRPGGLLVGFFCLGATDRGPPFAIAPGVLAQLLGEAFERIEDVPVDDSIAVFAGRERWQVWRRRLWAD